MRILSSDVRPAELSDAARIAAVHWDAWQNVYSGVVPHRILQQKITRRNVGWWSRAIRSEATILVLEVHDVLVGYASVGLNRARALPQEGEIYEIYLLPQYQGLGFGRQLFAEARQLLISLGCKGILCWCIDTLDQAGCFFSALGGRQIAFRQQHFGDLVLGKVAFAWD